MNASSVLPPSYRLPVQYLSGSFNSVTNSYKFFWLLAILEHVKSDRPHVIPVGQLLARMVAGVWYPSIYYRLSFGKMDRLGQIALAVRDETNLPQDARKREVIRATTEATASSAELAGEINSLGIYVPYRFLRPFFARELRGEVDYRVNGRIQELADQRFQDEREPCLYRFIKLDGGEATELHPAWYDYLQRHVRIVSGFCLWHLLNYLQANNPNVPNIAGKLFEPTVRELTTARRFWRLVFDALGQIRCIYSGAYMNRSEFSIDHFLPWSFVTHDLLWNLIPTPKSVNAAKSDQVPDFNRYYEPFARLQFKAVQTLAEHGKENLLEDHVLLLKKHSVAEIKALSFNVFEQVLRENIAPQIQIAKNMGFGVGWVHSAKREA